MASPNPLRLFRGEAVGSADDQIVPPAEPPVDIGDPPVSPAAPFVGKARRPLAVNVTNRRSWKPGAGPRAGFGST